jgi:hypothetical protein
MSLFKPPSERPPEPAKSAADAEPREESCPQMTNCPMYGLFSLAGTLETWKTNYCTADYSRCERYVRNRQGRQVPTNLMPNGALLRKPSWPGVPK